MIRGHIFGGTFRYTNNVCEIFLYDNDGKANVYYIRDPKHVPILLGTLCNKSDDFGYKLRSHIMYVYEPIDSVPPPEDKQYADVNKFGVSVMLPKQRSAGMSTWPLEDNGLDKRQAIIDARYNNVMRMPANFRFSINYVKQHNKKIYDKLVYKKLA
jgi:hypothetical protein